MIWANLAGASYADVRDTVLGTDTLHLRLSVGEWAADGLLALFFFTVGLELKQEFVTGDLRNPRQAFVPIAAATGGVVVPALIFVAITAGLDPDAMGGWAVPTATDIAFAVSVLAIAGRGLPAELRMFLLTLAVVDDLIAVAIIAVVYSDHLSPGYAAGALACLLVYTALVQRMPFGRRRPRLDRWWILLPLGLLAWVLMHASGIHATVAGVLLGLAVPARERAGRLEHLCRPWSNGVAVPVFAFFAAGVDVGGFDGLGHALREPVTLAVLAGLLLGKPLGVFAGAWSAARFGGGHLHPRLRWADIAAIGVLASLGFTVSLLVSGLAFGPGTRDDDVKVAIVCAAVVVALVGPPLLRSRRRATRRP